MDIPLETTPISPDSAGRNVNIQTRHTRDVDIPRLISGTINNLILAPMRKKFVIPPERKCSLYSRDGWKCTDCRKKDDCCISKEWICDGYHQCMDDDSDEVEGCALLKTSLKGS